MTGKPKALTVAVLISGTGSNLKVLIDACANGELDLDIVRVISNRAEAPGLEHARRAGIPVSIIDKATAGANKLDAAVADRLRADAPDLVLLSGYMRILGPELVAEFEGRMINQHPSLLPKFKGLHTYQRALEAGEPEHGASVHFVTAELDDGPVIAQTRMAVEAGDTEQSLAARLAPLEHQLIKRVMELFAHGRVTMEQGRAMLDGHWLQTPLDLTHE